MKRLTVSCMVAFTALSIGGCALPKPEFNQTYLPNTVPGAPERRIDLTAAVVNQAVKKGHLSDSDIKALPLSLYWIENDNLLFSILSKDRQKSLHSFLVTHSTGQIKALEDAEKDALLSKIEKKIVADKKGSLLGEFIGFAMQVTIALAGGGGGSSGGSSGGSHFLGNIENNGYVLDIDATVDRTKWSVFHSYDNCYYNINNRQTGETLKGKVKIVKFEEEQESLENWLKSWRISPDGRFYLIEETATFIVPEYNDTVQTLIKDYSYAALDVSPKWDHIALLTVKEDEKTKQINYWIEFYPFDYRKKPDRHP
jgi:hypothetical protein